MGMGFLALVWLLKFKSGLSFERFLRISLKFDSIGYMPYLRQILTSKPQKSSQNTSPYRFMLKFANLSHRDPHPENANLILRRGSAKFNLRIVQQLLTS